MLQSKVHIVRLSYSQQPRRNGFLVSGVRGRNVHRAGVATKEAVRGNEGMKCRRLLVDGRILDRVGQGEQVKGVWTEQEAVDQAVREH